MNLSYSLLLGLLQGLTEFIPVSSSGHLVLAQSLIPDFEQPGVLYDVFLHAGTLFSIVFYFRGRLLTLFRKYFFLLLVGSIPAAFAGLMFQNQIESFFTSVSLVGAALIVTGAMNYSTDKSKERKANLNTRGAFIVGILQALALIPGISRSGSTIFGGTYLGIDKRKAAEFSFLLSIPAVFGANMLEFFSHEAGEINFTFYILGFMAAFVSGYLAIRIMMRFLLNQRFTAFALYCLAVGLLAILY